MLLREYSVLEEERDLCHFNDDIVEAESEMMILDIVVATAATCPNVDGNVQEAKKLFFLVNIDQILLFNSVNHCYAQCELREVFVVDEPESTSIILYPYLLDLSQLVLANRNVLFLDQSEEDSDK